MPKSFKTLCKHGHPLSGENLYISPRGHRECKRCRYLSSKKWIREGTMSEATLRKVFEALHNGLTIRNITTGQRGRSGRTINEVGFHLVPYLILKRFCIENPKVGRRIFDLGNRNAKIEQSKGGQRRRRAVASGVRNESGDIFSVISQATSSLAAEVRDEVMSLMFIDASEGRLKPSEIKSRLREYLTRHNRENKYSVQSRWGHRSLDAVLFEDGTTTLGDTITHGLWN